jgi:hypothetical protein
MHDVRRHNRFVPVKTELRKNAGLISLDYTEEREFLDTMDTCLFYRRRLRLPLYREVS